MAVLIVNGALVEVSEEVLQETAHRILAQEKEGPLASFAQDLLSALEGEEDRELVALGAMDWVPVEALVLVDREELEELADTLDNEEVAEALWEKGAVLLSEEE